MVAQHEGTVGVGLRSRSNTIQTLFFEGLAGARNVFGGELSTRDDNDLLREKGDTKAGGLHHSMRHLAINLDSLARSEGSKSTQ